MTRRTGVLPSDPQGRQTHFEAGYRTAMHGGPRFTESIFGSDAARYWLEGYDAAIADQARRRREA